MTILVTGANGQLGSEFRALSTGEGHRFIFTDVAELDITSADAVNAMVRDEKVDAIVNCAAYTDVEAAEDNYAAAELLNATAVRNLADAMKATGGLLVHISTDYVFGAEVYNTPCREDMTGTPTGVYGLTKLHGEQQISESGCRSIIIRTAWLYSPYGRNFVKTILRLSAERPMLQVVFDQVGTPTYARDLAAAILKILRSPKEGIYNYSNEGVCSWYDFARAIVSMSGNNCEVRPCHSSEFPSKVKRPAYSVLDKTKIKETFGVTVPYWTDSLAECIDKLK
jgi:dTDP-4-dehydrorhamnose reductase